MASRDYSQGKDFELVEVEGLDEYDRDRLEDRGILHYTVENFPWILREIADAYGREKGRTEIKSPDLSSSYDFIDHVGNEREKLMDFLEEKQMIELDRPGRIQLPALEEVGESEYNFDLEELYNFSGECQALRLQDHAERGEIDRRDVSFYLSNLDRGYEEEVKEYGIPVGLSISLVETENPRPHPRNCLYYLKNVIKVPDSLSRRETDTLIQMYDDLGKAGELEGSDLETVERGMEELWKNDFTSIEDVLDDEAFEHVPGLER